MPLDGDVYPFDDDYPGIDGMAPCMRSCNHDINWNGCDNSRCWCNKGNLDLRVESITRCASTSCTFANMNTETDVSTLSIVQVQYCADRGFSPAGMVVPSTARASPTGSSGSVDSQTATATATDSSTRTRPTSGPAATSSSTSRPSSASTTVGGSSTLGVPAKAGIGIGAAFCVLLAALIVILLLRRRKPQPQYFPPPPNGPNNFQPGPPPPMAPTPYSGNGPFSPPPLQQPMPIHPPQKNYTNGDVSPIEEKAVPAVTVARKSVGSGVKADISNPTSPTPAAVTPAPMYSQEGPREVHGSVPLPRHEISNDGQITNTVSARGMELDSQQQQHLPPGNQYAGHQQYQESPQGQWVYGYQQGGPPAQELAGGQPGQGRSQFHGQQYGGAYELGSGR